MRRSRSLAMFVAAGAAACGGSVRFLLVGIILASALARPAAGQVMTDARLAAAAGALRAESYIRIAATGTRVEGHFLRTASDSLALRAEAGERRVALTAIDTLWQRQRGTGRGAMIGAVVGGVGLAALGVFFVNGLCESVDGCRDDYPRVIGAGLALGAGGGALLGAGVGSLTHRWRRLYP
jgi:hypothetical protein